MNYKQQILSMESQVLRHNHTGIDDFDGLTPVNMQALLYSPLKDKCMIQLNAMEQCDYDQVPILRLAHLITNEISISSEIKLTATGNLPPKIVKEIYAASGFIDDMIESGIVKITKESDVKSITQTRIILDLAGITKVRNGKLSLTKSGATIIQDDPKLLAHIFDTFGSKVNWCYFDGYPENDAGRLGFAFTMVMLGKYGNESRSDKFYSEKYYRAFPDIIDQFPENSYSPKHDAAYRCFSLRTFERFLKYFGVIDIQGKFYQNKTEIKTNILFTKMIRINFAN